MKKFWFCFLVISASFLCGTFGLARAQSDAATNNTPAKSEIIDEKTSAEQDQATEDDMKKQIYAAEITKNPKRAEALKEQLRAMHAANAVKVYQDTKK